MSTKSSRYGRDHWSSSARGQVINLDSASKRTSLTIEMLSRHWLFSTLETSDLEYLARSAHLQLLPVDTFIIARGNRMESTIGVVSGQVKVYGQSRDGRGITLNVIRPGEWFGDTALIDGNPSAVDVMTARDSEILILERRDFVPLLRQRPDVAISLLEALCGHLRDISQHAEKLLSGETRFNLAQAILRSAIPRLNTRTQVVELSQKALGEMIGLSRETINKQIRAWAKQGWIETYRGGLYVHDITALQQQAKKYA